MELFLSDLKCNRVTTATSGNEARKALADGLKRHNSASLGAGLSVISKHPVASIPRRGQNPKLRTALQRGYLVNLTHWLFLGFRRHITAPNRSVHGSLPASGLSEREFFLGNSGPAIAIGVVQHRRFNERRRDYTMRHYCVK
jgi:hypothetical protein